MKIALSAMPFCFGVWFCCWEGFFRIGNRRCVSEHFCHDFFLFLTFILFFVCSVPGPNVWLSTFFDCGRKTVAVGLQHIIQSVCLLFCFCCFEKLVAAAAAAAAAFVGGRSDERPKENEKVGKFVSRYMFTLFEKNDVGKNVLRSSTISKAHSYTNKCILHSHQ